jgi:3-dehydroquinate synthase
MINDAGKGNDVQIIFIPENEKPGFQFISNKEELPGNKYYILVDENTRKYCLPVLFELSPCLQKCNILEIPSGEDHKNINTSISLWHELIKSGADRSSVIINLGGGVICDIGGFVASAFKRGINFINIPTSLLAMADAAIGGKTGINFEHLKNEIGLFAHALKIIINPAFLRTLPEEHTRSGYAEIIKIALSSGPQLWDTIKLIHYKKVNSWDQIICDAVELKNNIVSIDPFEKNERKILNFGHTTGHAIESLLLESGNGVLHGEAIAAGIICELFISMKHCKFPETAFFEIKSIIDGQFSKTGFNQEDIPRILALMKHDKKNAASRINFTLLKAIGKPLIDQDIEEQLIRQSLDFYLEK